MRDLKGRTLRGGVAKSGAQAVNFVIRTGCLIIFARLLEPSDFGLVGMVTAITGLLLLFRDFGLSIATVQRAEITDKQTSTLFWINIAVGIALCLISAAIAPLVALFYREPRLSLIMAVLGLGFVFNAAGVQHSALLQRQLRFTTLALIDVVALVASSVISIFMALRGWGYWALVAWSVALPLTTTVQLWFASKWIPGRPSLGTGAGSMLRFGGVVTLNTLVIHIAYNLDKVLLGRFWGADALGIYGRAYQLITLPTDQINSTVGGVAISVLSRLQDDPQRLWSYFEKGYSVVLAATVPVAIMCAMFAEEIILVTFGPKWTEAVPVFRALVPTVLAFAVINPTGWLLVAVGMVGRSLRIALAIAPLVILGYALGLPYGAEGVALGFSVAMVLWIWPHLMWSFHGLGVSLRNVAVVIARPFISSLGAGLCAWSALRVVHVDSAWAMLVLGGTIFAIVYSCILLFVMKQGRFYLDIVRSLKRQNDGDALVAS